jgi:hypothetical protein
MLTPEKSLVNWRALSRDLPKLGEEELSQLLTYEKENKRRINFMLKIYGRYNKVREQRERNELLTRYV